MISWLTWIRRSPKRPIAKNKHPVRNIRLLLFLPVSLAAGTISLGSGSISVFGTSSDSGASPVYVTNPSAFAFVLTDGITTVGGQQRRNTDSVGGPNRALSSVATFDGRQTTISATISYLTIADSEGDSGGHSQAFAIGLCTGGWRDQAAATYNLNLIGSQAQPAQEGFAGIAFGYKNGSLYLAAYDYDGQPGQISFDLGKAGFASGNSISLPLSITLTYRDGSLSVGLNGQSLGSVPTSHDFSHALLVAMGASADQANGSGAMTFSGLTADTPMTPGNPAVLYPVSGDQQRGSAGNSLPQPLITRLVDAFRNPLSGVSVTFNGGNAVVSPDSVMTDWSGQAATNVTLGNAPGDASVFASVPALPLVQFHLTALGGPAVPSISSITNGADFGPKISSGGWATILGSNLSGATDTAPMDGASLPTSLDGVSVKIGSQSAFVYYVSPSQINLIVPDDPTNGGLDVQVKTQAGTSNIATADKEDFSPALFQLTATYPSAVHADGTYVGIPNLVSGAATHPARPGEVILLFGTGFGPTNPSLAAGQSVNGPLPPMQPVTATIGGVEASIQAYLTFAGVYQFNVTVPDLPPGDAPLVLSVGGSKTKDGLMLSIGQ